MRAVLRRAEPQTADQLLLLGDVVLRRSAREVSVAGNPVELRMQEFDLPPQWMPQSWEVTASGNGGSVSGATGEADGTATSGVALPSEAFPAAALGRFSGSGTVPASGARAPSKLMAGERPTATPSKAMLAISLDIRIARPLGSRAGMGDGAVARHSHLLGVFPQIS